MRFQTGPEPIRAGAAEQETIGFRSLRNWNITVLRAEGIRSSSSLLDGHGGRGSSPLAMTASYPVDRRNVDREIAATINAYHRRLGAEAAAIQGRSDSVLLTGLGAPSPGN